MLLSTQEYQTPNNNNPNTPTRHSTSISECLTKDVKKALPPTMLKTNACMHASAGDQTGCYEAEEDNRVYWLGHRVKRQRKYM
jgi:hypothetical protein